MLETANNENPAVCGLAEEAAVSFEVCCLMYIWIMAYNNISTVSCHI